jgi:hypothetical protein
MKNNITLLRAIGTLVLAGYSSSAFPQSLPEQIGRGEQAVLATAREPVEVIAREHIILAWPKDLKPQWCEEAKVTNPQQMADWLERAYQLSAQWTRFDSNAHYARRNQENIRLIFIHNGSSDFVCGGRRPFVGLRDLKQPPAGSGDWFGWLMHELSHDFWHEHPAFARVKNRWGEGMCDYERYWLLLRLGMPNAARRWDESLQQARPDDAYRGGAWVLLRYQREHHLDGPAALWNDLWDKDFTATLGKPQWLHDK